MFYAENKVSLLKPYHKFKVFFYKSYAISPILSSGLFQIYLFYFNVNTVDVKIQRITKLHVKAYEQSFLVLFFSDFLKFLFLRVNFLQILSRLCLWD